ncbi:hypothetical protein LXA43DRAFT_842313, partial [Ganoderma leucocontextum]
MIKTAKKYDVVLESRKPAKALKDALPIWYHLGLRDVRSPANTISGKCMRENHGVMSVLDCVKLASRARQPGNHRNSATCQCGECVNDRSVYGCSNPARCAEMAVKMIDKLEPKWNPEGEGNADNLTLTRSRKRANERAREAGGRITFDPSITDDTTPAECLRVFVDGNGPRAAVKRTPRPYAIHSEEVEIF